MLRTTPGALGLGPPSRSEAGWGSPSLCSRLALRVLCLAQRQYSLLQAANLLTPDMIAEFEMLQQLVQEENTEPGAEATGEPGPARGSPLAQELRSESSESQPCSACLLVPRGGWGPGCWVMVRSETGPLGSWTSAQRGPRGHADPRSQGLLPVPCLSPQILQSLLPSGQSLISPQHPPLCPESPGYSGPVTRTMARQLSGLIHALGVPPRPDRTSAQASRRPTGKKRRRPSPLEPDSLPGPKPGTKLQRQSLLPCLRRGTPPEARLPCGPITPTGGRASSPCHSPHFCPATVIKSRVPLGPSALQNCSTPLALPARDLNATFDLSEETPSKLGFHECIGWDNVPQELNRLDQPFIPRWVSLLASQQGGQGSARDRGAAQGNGRQHALGVGTLHLFPFGLTSIQAQESRTCRFFGGAASLQALPCPSTLQSRQLCAGL